MDKSKQTSEKKPTLALPVAVAAAVAALLMGLAVVFVGGSLPVALALSAAGAGVVAFITLTLLKNKLAPLDTMAESLEGIIDLERSTLALPKPLPQNLLNRSDEVGRLARALASTEEGMETLLGQLDNAADARAKMRMAADLRALTARQLPPNDRFTLETDFPAEVLSDKPGCRAFYADDTHLVLALTQFPAGEEGDTQQALTQYALCSLLELGATAGMTPWQILALINRQLHAEQKGAKLWLGIVDLELGHLRTAAMGFAAPVLVQRDGTRTDLPIGASADLLPGDGILAESGDGVLLRFRIDTLRQNNSIVTPGDEESRAAVSRFVEDQLTALEPDPRKKCILAVDEIYGNISKNSDASVVCVTCRAEATRVVLAFRYDGAPYDPVDAAGSQTMGVTKDRSIGGLGIFVVRKFMQDIKYRRVGEENRLLMKMPL